MSNIEAAAALFTAINFDRFEEIAARHNPDVVFHSFRGPTLRNSTAVGDWHREFLRDYADCNYAEVEYAEQGNALAARATIEAKGYDWRPVSQRIVEVLEFEDGGVSARRLYAMLPDFEYPKAAADQLRNARGARGNASQTAAAVNALFESFFAGDLEGAKAALDPKAVLIDSVFGMAVGPENIVEFGSALPRPAFGARRVTRVIAGEKDAAVEIAIDASRPRTLDWVRVVDGKVVLIEVHWMLREIGIAVSPGARERKPKQVILPI